MSNIAQMINILQSLILTDGKNMILTPTYWVYDMFKCHQNASRVHLRLKSDFYKSNGTSIPQLSASASKNVENKIHLSLCNLHHKDSARIEVHVASSRITKISGRILTGPSMNTHNSFEEPETIEPTTFESIQPAMKGFMTELPSKSIVTITIE